MIAPALLRIVTKIPYKMFQMKKGSKSVFALCRIKGPKELSFSGLKKWPDIKQNIGIKKELYGKKLVISPKGLHAWASTTKRIPRADKIIKFLLLF